MVGQDRTTPRADANEHQHIGRYIPVWDIGVRLFHWSLVVSVAVSLYTGLWGKEWQLDIHLYAGYSVAALLLFRLVWFFFGGEFARFEHFPLRPRMVVSYARDLIHGKHTHQHLGHNPLGSVWILLALMVLLSMTATGFLLAGGVENQGPLASVISYTLGDQFRLIHLWLGYFMLALIPLHLAGVVFESVREKRNLVASMVHGKKLTVDYLSPRPVQRVAALSVIAILSVSIIWGWRTLNAMPASGLVAMPPNEIFVEECSACHYHYHPSLLPAASWHLIMADLEDHFGEDASLDEESVQIIEDLLLNYAAEKWDTEAANHLRLVNAEDPLRITATQFWQRRHETIDLSVFEHESVSGKGNCVACHRDAESGRFDDHQIQIP